MCRRSEALDAQIDAANCLSATCSTRIGTQDALRELYRRVTEEPLPAAIEQTLAKLGARHGVS